jgi:chromosome segregation ATPase
LRLEDAQTALAEKERLNNELQQEKATLRVQVGKWKSLDDRGGAEVEELRKQRTALETQIKHLQSRVTEEQNKALAHEKAFQKEHKKTEKLQQALEEQTVRTHIMTLSGDFAKPCFNCSVLRRRQNL